MLVSFFSLVGLTSMSPGREFSPTIIPYDINGATVILVDDVLHSGRTVKAALDELFDHGRPTTVELAVLFDRNGRKLPVAATYCGLTVSATDDEKVVEHLRTSQPNRRFGLVTTTNDEVVRLFFGYGFNDLTPFVDALVTRQYSGDNAKAFELAGTQHVLLGGYQSVVAADGTTLKSFFDAWATGDATWNTVRP